MDQSAQVNSGGASGWLFQRVSGVAIVLLILLHFVVLHFGGGGEVNYNRVVARLSTPFWKVIDLTFLTLALTHGLYGLWLIAGDYLNRSWMRIMVFFILSIGGIVLFALGAITIIPFAAKF